MYKTFYFNNLLDSYVDEFLSDYKKSEWYGQSKIQTSDDDYQIYLSVPGLTKNDLNIMIDNDLIIIKHEPKKEEKTKLFFVDSFEKKYKLPKDIVIDKIEAVVKNGVCTIKLPKDKEKIKQKLITIS